MYYQEQSYPVSGKCGKTHFFQKKSVSDTSKEPSFNQSYHKEELFATAFFCEEAFLSGQFKRKKNYNF